MLYSINIMRLTAAAALLSVALAVAGCGNSSSPTVARLGASTASGSTAAAGGGGASSGPSSPSALGSDARAFARCMRSNGVPGFPDPNAGGGFLFHARAGVIPHRPRSRRRRRSVGTSCPARPRLGAGPFPADAGEVSEDRAVHAPARRSPVPRPSDLGPVQPIRLRRRVISDIEGVILIFPSTIDHQAPAFTRASAAVRVPAAQPLMEAKESRMPHSTDTRRLTLLRARLFAAAALVSGVLVTGCGEALQARGAARAPRRPRQARSNRGSPSPGASARTGCRTSPTRKSVAKRSGWARREPCSARFQSAARSCQRLLPKGPPSSEPPSSQARARMLEVSACMRKHGISGFPDPTSTPSNRAGNSAIIGSGGYHLAIPKSVDTSSPAFEQAAAVCNFGPGR